VLVEVVRLRGGSPSANSFWCNLSHYTLDAALEPRLYIGSLCSNLIIFISKGVVVLQNRYLYSLILREREREKKYKGKSPVKQIPWSRLNNVKDGKNV
jgi:hypothetical protein